ncbi:MAG: FAD binding domain-containing protein [Dehalococcoidia bacterium]|nr:FAD binding domain-containing protein [Dehalococcoidia bacterium]
MYQVAHVNANTVNEATAALGTGKAMAIAGGTDLVPYLKGMFSPIIPDTVVNLKTISGLSGIKEEGSILKIGALTTLAEIAKDETVKSKYNAIAEAAKAVAAPELRNMGTIGGNICQSSRCTYYRNEYNDFPCLRKVQGGRCYALTGYHRKYHSVFGQIGQCFAACPSDVGVALVAMGASIETSSRTIKASDFFANNVAPNGEGINVLNANEIVKEIQVPTPAAGTKSAYRKFSFRKSIDFPVVSVAVVATISGGNVSNASIVLGGVYGIPRRATGAETAINNGALNTERATAAGDAATTGSQPLINNHYKLQIIKTLVRRTLLLLE